MILTKVLVSLFSDALGEPEIGEGRLTFIVSYWSLSILLFLSYTFISMDY
jgi:hypothetical protein